MPTSTYLIQAISQDACAPPGLLGSVADPALDEHLQRVGLELARVLGDGQYHLRRSQSDPPLMNPGI